MYFTGLLLLQRQHVSCAYIDGRSYLRLERHMTTTAQQLGVPGGTFHWKFFRIRCSEITSEAIFGPKLATTLARTSSQHSSYHA